MFLWLMVVYFFLFIWLVVKVVATLLSTIFVQKNFDICMFGLWNLAYLIWEKYICPRECWFEIESDMLKLHGRLILSFFFPSTSLILLSGWWMLWDVIIISPFPIFIQLSYMCVCAHDGSNWFEWLVYVLDGSYKPNCSQVYWREGSKEAACH